MMTAKIAYQGEPGANSHIACLEAYPDHEPLSCRTFEDAFQAVRDGQARLAMIPIDNSVAGRVADIHHLMPASNLAIIGEHFLRVHHQLLVLPGTDLKTVKTVHSHVHALGQCRKAIRDLGLSPVVAVDTAGAARELSENRNPARAAIATRLAGEIYGLELARENIEDEV
ncbi:MAG TPA: prephenate dehydratase domain-containing protein, partial [Aestuariivirga sp.]|nr:prephenate dehydratase domain-containing protein [Aestuariivirga sp.]